MTIEQIIGLSIALLIMLVGVLGSILPALPSTPIVFIGALLHKLYFGEQSASVLVVGILLGLTLFSFVLDFLASVIGARKLGATWKGAVGAVAGAVVGLFFSLPGLLLGPFIGAVVFELVGGRGFRQSAHAGFGAVLGMLLGAVGKLACSIAMMLLFLFSVLGNSGQATPLDLAAAQPEGTPALLRSSAIAKLRISFSRYDKRCDPWFEETDGTEFQIHSPCRSGRPHRNGFSSHVGHTLGLGYPHGPALVERRA